MSQEEPNFKYHVNLYDAWVEAGKPSKYAIRRDTKIAWETARRYLVEGGVMMQDLPNAVLVLLGYFKSGETFYLADYVKVIREGGEGDASLNKIEGLPMAVGY